MSKEVPDFCYPPPPKNYKISSAFSYNFKLALTVLMAEFGARPLREIKKLRQYMRDGTPQPLTVGGYGYGKYRWSIVSYDAEIRRTTRDGEVLEAAVSLTLQEYLKHELQSKRKLRRLVKAPV